MITHAAKLILLILSALCITACSTTPQSNYYVLSAAEVAAISGSTPSVGVGPISMPEYLNRERLVSSRDGNALHLANFDRWAEPISEGMLRVIMLNLAQLLDTENVQRFPWRRSQQPDYSVQIDLLKLDASAAGSRLLAEWSLIRVADRSTLVRRLSDLREPLPGSELHNQDIPALYSNLLLQLSKLIAAEISAAEDSGNTTAG
jgi:uncharacterized lipoprotein YmbA